ncbi:MAG: thermonuclease family protein [Thermoleophilia bacterium]|nr:thermonuclease family protein [Thermoleophilia bacterium]
MKKFLIATVIIVLVPGLGACSQGSEDPFAGPDASTEIPAIKSGTGAYEYAPVIEVVDGDTLRAIVGGRPQSVRLIGIDTPETLPGEPAECYGPEAAARLAGLVEGKTVRLEADPSQGDRDRYGRLLRYVFLDGVDINRLLVEEGFAREFTFRTAYRYQTEFKEAEAAAREDGRGLWSACG